MEEKLQRARDREGGVRPCSDNVTDIEKRDTRAEVARESKIPERKLRYAAEVRRTAPELAVKVRAGDDDADRGDARHPPGRDRSKGTRRSRRVRPKSLPVPMT